VKISRRANLDRYYLFQCRWFAIFLHKIHHDEVEGVYHSHPWSWFSLIFGWYREHKIGRAPRNCVLLNRCRAGDPHRVTLPAGTVWTLCIHGRRRCQWKVFNECGDVLDVEPWRGVEKQDRKEYRP
jgi:hypothetical protein